MTTLQEAAQRARFEAELRKQSWFTASDLNRRDFPSSERFGEYCDFSIERMWRLWRAALASEPQAEPVAWVEVIDTDEGPYNFNGLKLLAMGKHNLYTHPAPAEQPGAVGLSQILHDPENQPSQYGTVPLSWSIAKDLNDSESDAVRMEMARLLDGVALALRGEPGELKRWSWHDLPDRAAAAITAIDVMTRAAALATQPAAPGWIPVSEVLPAEEEPVLIAAWAWGNADGQRIYGVATRRGETWFNPQDSEALGEWWPATHWMPIPPPPAATQGAKT